MTTRHPLEFLVLLPALFAGTAAAQDMNVKCGLAPIPSPSYGAASGQVGAWNHVLMPSPSAVPVGLVDLNGQATGATALAEACDSNRCDDCDSGLCPGFSGNADDAALLNSWSNGDCLGTHVLVEGLAPGSYRMHVYVYHGCNPSLVANVNLSVMDSGFSTVHSSSFQVGGAAYTGSWAGFPVGVQDFDIAPDDSVKLAWGSSYPGGVCGFQLDRLDDAYPSTCAGDGFDAACPCGNDGGSGRGCQNSMSTGGAFLSVEGSTHPDTIVLQASHELPSALTIFLQGTANVAPIDFGDGLRCAGGPLKRLYVKNASGGVAISPAPGDPSVSERATALGDVLDPGARRYYQTYYRDPNTGFCPPPQGANFNASQMRRITW